MKMPFATCCLLVSISLLSGCGSLNTQPWQKGRLAQPGMQLNPRPLQQAVDDHIYFSRESAAGGRGFSGGGCGCN